MKKTAVIATIASSVLIVGGGAALMLNQPGNDRQLEEQIAYTSTVYESDTMLHSSETDTMNTSETVDDTTESVTTETDTTVENTETESISETEVTSDTENGTTSEEVTTTEKQTENETKEETENETTEVESQETPAVYLESISAEVIGTHYVGDTLNSGDFKIVVWYSDNSSKDNPSGWSASPLYLSSETNQLVVSYENVSTSITVNAIKRPEVPATETTTTTQGNTVPSTVTPTTEQPTTTQPVTTQAETTTQPETTTQSTDGVIPYSSYLSGKTAMDDINAYRSAAGVAPVIWSDGLYAAAMIRAKQISESGDYGHLHDIGGEIHAQTSLATIAVSAWKQSSGHYEYMIGEREMYCAVATYGNCTVGMFSTKRPIVFNDFAFSEIMPAVENIFDGKMTLQEYESIHYPEVYAELIEVLNE